MDSDIYFFIYYPRIQKEVSSDIKFENCKDIPDCIYIDEKFENSIYHYKKVYKVKKSTATGKKANNYYFEFIINADKYIIFFDSKESTYIYDVTLEVGRKEVDIRKKIKQNAVEYYEKVEHFIAALEANGENNKVDVLFKDTLELYSKKKGFSFLIILFLKIYLKKDLCISLLKKFKAMNLNPKDNEKNMDRKSFLKDYKSKFKEILSESDKIIEQNNYNPIEFYGLLLCYINFYDNETFPTVIEQLYKKAPNELYEILLFYSAHFKYPLKQDIDFFNNFIQYTITNKEFSIFNVAINYIKDIESFLDVMDKNKELIFKKYIEPDISKNVYKCIVKIDNNIKFKKAKIIDYNPIIIDTPSDKEKEKEEKEIEQKETIEESSNVIKTKEKKTESDNEEKITQIDEKYFEEKVKKKIQSIIDFCKNKNIFLIYMTNNFWNYTLNYYNEPNQDNIKICFDLRVLFKNYYELVKIVFAKKDDKFTIKNEANIFLENDEFAFILEQIIKKFINDRKDLTEIEKLAFITKYNPYYIPGEYSNRIIDSEIFDSVDLKEIDKDFIKYYRDIQFENIFKENLYEYITKIIGKIKNVSNFVNIIKLFNFQLIEAKNLVLNPLKIKYETIIKNEKGELTPEQLNEVINVSAYLSFINYIYGAENEKLDFIKDKIKKLKKKIIPLVYIETMKIYIRKLEKKQNEADDQNNDDEDEDEEDYITENIEKINFQFLIDYIFDEFVKINSNHDIDNIITLIDCLEGKFLDTAKGENKNEEKIEIKENKEEREKMVNEFLTKLIDKNLFKKEEFFSSGQNLKITLLYNLYKYGKIKDNNNYEEYNKKIRKLLNNIKKDIEGKIKKKKLEEFLNNSESFILQRLSLINLTSKGFIPRDEYKKLQRKNEEINKDIKNLEYIRENIIIYHKVYYQDTIKKIIDIIHDNKNKEISQYKTEGKIKEIIKESDNLKVLAEKVEKVKTFLLFNVLYELNITEDEDKTFNKAYKELDNIRDLLHNNIGVDELYKKYKVVFDKIRDKLSNNEETAKEFIKNLTDYYNINNENLIDDLKILFKSKKYELDINSIIFFFDNFKKEYSEDKEWDNKLSNKYKDLSQKSFEEIKLELKELQKNEIYNYNDVQDYILFYTCLYDKKEAIDFLLTKIDKNLDDLKDRIQPTDKKLTYKDILDTEDCISHFKKMNGMEFKNKIFIYIKTSIGENKNVISQFDNYSKIYNSIIELDRYYDSSDNFYEQINNIIKDELSLPITKDLSSNFEKIYDLIISNEEIKKDEQFYNELRYILFKEINKISDNNYQSDILDKLLEKKEMIKKSNDIFQILLKNNLKKDKYKDSANSILTGDNIILKIIEKGLNKKNFILSETLFYLFEKNTLNYLKSVLKNKSVDLDNEPLEILKECIKILELYINKPEKFEGKIKELCKLFCLSYIKTYCYIFIKSFESANPKVKNPKDIIDSINNNNNLCKMIRLYIYKILYNNYTIEFFDNKENIIKYNLNNYRDFNKIMKIQDSINIYQIDYKIKTLNEGYYDKAYEVIKQYKSEDFKTKISGIFISDYKLYEYGIDNFYVVTYNSTLSNLLKRKYKFNNNFYTNICQPLFEKEKLLLKGIQLFYEEDKYKRIARLYKIEFNNIRPLLFGYRYCLNELFLKNTLGIYYPLYQGKVNYLKEKFYPGNDTKFNKVYSFIKNHFKIKPEEGCYVCLCKEWFYQSIPSGFPGKSFLNKSCPKCHKSVGATKKGNKIEIIKRDGYFRIFKDYKEIELINNDKSKKEKLKEINYMTLEQFEEQYIIKHNKEEKGIFITDKNGFKNDKKIIRYLSQISYRLLNYILYVHLFFARAVSDKNNFDKYIPKNMGEFVDTINECWKILKNELLKLNINSIEEFMHYVFIYLFPILNQEKAIDTYEQLISFENILEKKIQELIIRFKDGSNKLDPMKETDINKDVATINLLKEKYASSYYNESEYPFYDYFYYTDYLNENYIYEKLNQNDPNTYPILKLYLDSILLKDEKKKYSLNKLNLFNSTLNLINEKYTNKISREIAKKRLKDDEVYINNKELFDNFIKFYNKLEFKIQLTTENKLCDFFIDEDNEYGKTYLNIYKKFIKKQNEELEKIEIGIFDETCKNKINIQQINEEEIFNLELPEE